MNDFLEFLRTHKKISVISALAVVVIILGLFCRKDETGDLPVSPYNSAGFGMGAMAGRNYPCYQQPMVYQGMPSVNSMQPAAFQSNTLRLAMGVTLEGRGTVIAVEPGSSAERAGIQTGDLINRINGQ